MQEDGREQRDERRMEIQQQSREPCRRKPQCREIAGRLSAVAQRAERDQDAEHGSAWDRHAARAQQREQHDGRDGEAQREQRRGIDARRKGEPRHDRHRAERDGGQDDKGDAGVAAPGCGGIG